MFNKPSKIKSTRPTLILMVTTVLGLMLLAPPAFSDEIYGCWADCGDCWGAPWWQVQDCNYGGCTATGQTVACQSGCCLESDMGFCYSFYNMQFYSYVIECGILPPGWLTDDPEALKLYEQLGPCLDIGVNPAPRADGHADWVVIETDAVARLTDDDVRVLASSSGVQALLPDLDPETLAARMNEIRTDVDKANLAEPRPGLIVGVYPPLQSRTIRLDTASFDGRQVAIESGEALFEIELTAKGLIRDARALYWDDAAAVAALLPLLQGKVALHIDEAGKALDGGDSFHGLVYLVAGDGAVQSTLAYGYHLTR